MISIHALREEGDLDTKIEQVCRDIISIHALREEGDANAIAAYKLEDISIHALREEGDIEKRPDENNNRDFYPRPPRGGRRVAGYAETVRAYFYPRPPRGGRQDKDTILNFEKQFLSTPSARRATRGRLSAGQRAEISIHALREEGDSKNGEKHLRFCFIIKRSAQIWKSLSKNIRKKSRDLHRTA